METISISPWILTQHKLPTTARCVLATDGEAHFIACYEPGEWTEVYTEEPIDSVILAWQELPPPPVL